MSSIDIELMVKLGNSSVGDVCDAVIASAEIFRANYVLVADCQQVPEDIEYAKELKAKAMGLNVAQLVGNHQLFGEMRHLLQHALQKRRVYPEGANVYDLTAKPAGLAEYSTPENLFNKVAGK
jgi:hypothetical protein